MNSSARAELVKLVQNDVDLGFILLETYRLSASMGHTAHAVQALQSAEAAFGTAAGFLPRLTEEEADRFRPKLEELASAIRSYGSTMIRQDVDPAR